VLSPWSQDDEEEINLVDGEVDDEGYGAAVGEICSTQLTPLFLVHVSLPL
jgi:hypothetical protein